MAKTYITLDTRIDTWKDEFNNLVNKVGDLGQLTTSASGDSDLVQAINEHSAELGTITAGAMGTTASTVATAFAETSAELGTITAGAMGTTASTVSTAIAELDAEADSDRSNFAANVKKLMLDDGVSKEITSVANNSTNETTFLTFVDGATGTQGIETDTGLTYNPSSGNLVIGGELTAATLDISGNVDIDGTLEVGAISGTSADFDAGVTIDNITIDGTEIDLSSGDLTVDVAGDIDLDAGGNNVTFNSAGTEHGRIVMDEVHFKIKSTASDADVFIQGNDGGSGITALRLDMSNAGAATFNSIITSGAGLVIADGATIGSASDLDALTIASGGRVTASVGVTIPDGGLTLASTAVSSTAAELNKLDGATVVVGEINALDLGSTAIGTAIASKAVILDANKDYTGVRNLTITGELDAASLDISGNVDIDGTLEADAITLDGVTLAETISDTVGAMVGSNTETGITVTYEDADNTLDFVMGTTQTTITSLKNAALVVGRDADNDIDFATDNNIIFRAAGADQIKIIDGAIVPVTDNDIDLGTSSLEFKDAYFDGTVTADAFAGPITGNITGNATGTAGVGTLVTVQAEDTQNSNRFVTFVDAQTGNRANKTDANLTYNPNTNMLTTNVTGNVTGNLTGNLIGSGTDQPNITSLGTLSTLSVDNININGNTIISTDTNGDINITPQGDGDILLDGAVNIRAGVITGVTAITATNLTGTASIATKLATTRAFSITGDVTASAINFDGTGTVALNTSIAANAVVTASINADAVTSAKIADNAINSEHYVDGSIDRAHLAADIVDGTKIADDVINSEHYAAGSIDFEHIQNITGNSVLVRNASSSGVVSSIAVADTEILIGDGTGFVNEPITGDITMANTGVVTMTAAQTNITSLLATDIKIGEDNQTKIDFETADEIHFYAANAHQIKLVDGALVPVTDNDIDLGTSSLEFKNAFFDGTVTSDAFAGPLTGNVTGNASGTAATVTGAAQSSITSLGTLTTLTVDDITINASTISDAGTMTMDIGGDLNIDVGGGDIRIKDDGTSKANIGVGTGILAIQNMTSDADISFIVSDNGSNVNALILDGENAGNATFNGTVTAPTFIGAVTGNASSATTAATVSDNAITQAKMADDAIGQNELKTLRTFTLKDSGGSTLFTLFGAGA